MGTIVKLAPDSLPPAMTKADLATWLRKQADDVDAGEWPELDQVTLLMVSRGSRFPVLACRSLGKWLGKLELIGLLQLTVHTEINRLQEGVD